MKKIKAFGLFLLNFLIFFLLIFMLLASILVCVSNYTDVTSICWLWLCAGISSVLSISASVLNMPREKKMCRTKFSLWLERHFPKLLIGYLLLIIALSSTVIEPTWDVDTVHEILSLQWTIFGLSLAIFLAWDVIIINFLKERQPKALNTGDLAEKYKLYLAKSSFLQEIESTFSTIILLSINLSLLLVSTSQIYINSQPNTAFTQNILRCSYFFSINSLVGLFWDILKPLKEEKAKMLKTNFVTKEDIDNAHAAMLAQTVVSSIKEYVISLDPQKYSNEEKEKIFIEYMDIFKEFIKSDNSHDSKEKENDPSN